MASLFKKTMLYLGLAPDDDYGRDYAEPEPDPQHEVRIVPRQPAPAAAGVELHSPRTVRALPLTPQPLHSRHADADGVDLRVVRPSVVRPLPRTSAKPHTVTPSSFDEAQEVADRFKQNQPVILNLFGLDRDLARRMIDFSSGVCYALGGNMEKVTNGVYLLSPANVEVSDDERRRMTASRVDA